MLNWIPLVGPIIQGIVSIYTSFKDKQVSFRNDDVEEAKVSTQIIHDTNDDICLRILRDAAILPVVVWTMLIGWDTIIVRKWPSLMWHVDKYPDSVVYLPYVVLVFLFGNIGLNMWVRK